MSIPTGAGFFGEPVVLTVIGALLAFGVLFWWTHREQLPGASAHARGAEPARARTACTMRVLRGTAEPSAARAPAPRPAPTATAALPAASSSAGAGVSASDDDDDANEGSGGSESSASVDADVDDEIDSEEDVLLVMREWGTRGQATRSHGGATCVPPRCPPLSSAALLTRARSRGPGGPSSRRCRRCRRQQGQGADAASGRLVADVRRLHHVGVVERAAAAGRLRRACAQACRAPDVRRPMRRGRGGGGCNSRSALRRLLSDRPRVRV